MYGNISMNQKLINFENSIDSLLGIDITKAEPVEKEIKKTVVNPIPRPTPVKDMQPLEKKAAPVTVEMSKDWENKLDELDSRLDLLDDMDESIEGLKQTIDDKLSVDFDAMYENVMDQLNVEAVKEYRNIQAVIVEENAKQNHVLLNVDDKTNKLKKRLNHVMICAIVSFVVSVLVMLMQILPALGIKLF